MPPAPLPGQAGDAGNSLPATATKTGVALLPATAQPLHERQSHTVLGQLLAGLLGCEFLGSTATATPDVYFVPSDTLLGDTPRQLGITGPQDFFGGAVSHPFMATKAIAHPVLSPQAAVPPAWSYRFAEQTQQAVLAGFTVFRADDAVDAAARLLQHGEVRVKPVQGKAGRGQQLIRSLAELERYVSALDAHELATWGLVLEENLRRVVTFSVGQVHFGGLVVSYYGTQRLTRDHRGETVYGGSQLTLYRGGYETLLEGTREPALQQAIAQARCYDAAARSCYPTLIASRLNYDVAQGLAADGSARSGVLEHSWRIGGASGAEILALRAFATDSACRRVEAWTTETYGKAPTTADPTVRTTVLFDGVDDDVGAMTKTASIRIG